MRVLVTGSDGYIGAVLSSVLFDRGHDVVGLDTGFYRDRDLYARGERMQACIRKDIRRVTVEDVRGFDAVVHLAELSNDPLGRLDPAVTYDINLGGSTGLARLCKAARVARFVYSSSCSVYGIGTDDYRTEESVPAPQTAYAACKVLVEQQVAQLADETFAPTFLRNATVYGPSPRMRFDLVVNDLAGSAWTTGEIRMTSDGSPYRPVVHVLDVCAAVAAVLDAPSEAVANQILNVGDTAENYRVSDLAEIVAGAFPGCRTTFGPRSGDRRSYRVSFEKIRAVLPGFRCQRTAATGARELRGLFERIALTRDVFESRSFTRVKQLTHLRDEGLIDRNLYWTALARERAAQ
jgi:nucleoside-diphosphate-sugar epimerase